MEVEIWKKLLSRNIDNLKNVKLSSDSNIKFPLVAFSKTVKLRGQEYQLELVDTAGQVIVAGY